MNALFVAPDMVVIADAVSNSENIAEFRKRMDSILDGDYAEKTKDIINNPANLRFSWIKFEKKEEDVDFFSNLALLSANNNYTVSTKEVIMTQDSVFVNMNLMKAFKDVSMSSKENETDIDISLEGRISKDTARKIADEMFMETRFYEIVSTKNGPQLFMLEGNFTNDTWSLLENFGPVARKNPAQQFECNCTTRRPGFCYLFGLSMTALAQVVESATGLQKHVAEDLAKLPKESDKNEKD